ncbi:hypothetical protein GCM10009718_36870 [Isoptericola halotolerans]|uniref:Uncharacterized protein n=1 Tax=Isoptericola halotolerans TaxID=300560 RepID=A0ABX2A9J9_9MICO|nr:hypothetical protein [Isoptericola halotolerans]NOV98750.1 hypothetical protein [Isoptericola halotolerans]
MRLRRCTYCESQVDVDAGPHIHDPKECQDCGDVLLASSFPRHPSSLDGRRHQCARCIRLARDVEAVQEHVLDQGERKRENDLLREHGYAWRIGKDRDLILLSPSGTWVDRSRALIEVGERSDEPQWVETHPLDEW